MHTSAWAARSATVTGDESALETASPAGSKSSRTALVSRLAATTASMANPRSVPRREDVRATVTLLVDPGWLSSASGPGGLGGLLLEGGDRQLRLVA